MATDGVSIGFSENLFLCLAPFVVFIAIFFWGLQKKTRKNQVIKAGYVLIGVEILFCGILPIMTEAGPYFKIYWASVPLAMVSLSLTYMAYRRIKDREYETLLINEIVKGNVSADMMMDAGPCTSESVVAEEEAKPDKLQKKGEHEAIQTEVALEARTPAKAKRPAKAKKTKKSKAKAVAKKKAKKSAKAKKSNKSKKSKSKAKKTSRSKSAKKAKPKAKKAKKKPMKKKAAKKTKPASKK